MSQVILNTFEIQNLHDLDFSYQLLSIEIQGLNVNEHKEFRKALEKACFQVSSKIEGPAVPIFREGKPYIAIPSDREVGEMKVRTNPLTAILTPLAGNFKTHHGSGDSQLEEIVFEFLDFEIRRQIGRWKELGSLGSHEFILKKPAYPTNNVEVMERFEYRLVRDDNDRFGIVLNFGYSYLEAMFLSDKVNAENINSVRNGLVGETCLYLNGDNWYPVEVKGFGSRIDQHEFRTESGEYQIVLEYILNRTKNASFSVSHLLKPEHLTLLCVYPGRDMQNQSCATSLAKRILPTDHPRVQALHRKSIKRPPDRFGGIRRLVQRYLKNLYFDGIPLDITFTPKEEPLRVFPIPELKFNHEVPLKKGTLKSDGGRVSPGEIPKMRRRYLKENGLLKQGDFMPQYLVVPKYWDEPLADAVRSVIDGVCKSFASSYPGIEKDRMIPYRFNPDIPATEQVDLIKKQMEEHGATSGYALFVLPGEERIRKHYLRDMKDLLKRAMHPDVWFQCASATNIERYFEPVISRKNDYLKEFKLIGESDHESYFDFLSLEFLTLQRKWAYALAKPLHYDVYIGIDSAGRQAGFCVFLRNGEQIFFDYLQMPQKPKGVRTENIKDFQIVEKVLPILKKCLPLFAPNPNGIVIVQDGKSYGNGQKALELMIEALHNDKIVDKDTIKRGVVDLHKLSATPLRMALKNYGSEKLENPPAGAFKIYKKRKEPEGFLFNTGYPFHVPGTVKPVQYIMRSGNINFEWVLEDLFCQTMMPFSAPSLPNSLPACIKLIDTFLGHTGTAYDEREHRTERKPKAEQRSMFPVN
jgi:hypothetical protein